MSWLATISDTTIPAPKDETRLRNGKSVIPAKGASITGGFRVNGSVKIWESHEASLDLAALAGSLNPQAAKIRTINGHLLKI